MSFGFSIGDIILLSQLAYNLYASISSGRQAASRDLKELEEVLFSLKCALDHLGEVSNDVLARPGFRYGGSAFKEKLDVMVNSCASTVQELDTVTKKYRDVESKANKGKTKLRTLEDVKKSIQVNWQRVRWDHEKQSLQQYREKLKSHTDAINLMLTSVVCQPTGESELCKQGLPGHNELPVATVKLNNERRAFGAKEYEAFIRRYAQPKRVPKPSFLTSIMPTSQELQACIPYIFQSTAEGKQQTQELRDEINRWTEGFSRFINHKAPPREKDECFLMLLGALNEAVENSSRGMRQLFYETSDSSGFATALDQVQTISKSVRVMKEIEEFEDAKEEWEKQERVR
ncbi:unnamed protein product [Alternaria alternata]